MSLEERRCKLCGKNTPTGKLFYNREDVLCCEACYMMSTRNEATNRFDQGNTAPVRKRRW